MAIAGQAGYTFDPTKLNDQELNDYLNFYKTGAARDNPANPTSKVTLDLIQRIQDEQAQRQSKSQADTQKQDLLNLFNGGGGGQAGGGFNPDQYAQNQRAAIDQIFQNQRNQGVQELNDQFNQQRGQALDEAAVNGTLRQPGFQSSTINNIDAMKAKAMQQLFSSLGIGEGQARVGAESDIANRGLQAQGMANQRAASLGGLLQGNNQFGQTFGLEQNKFNSGQRQQALENMFNQQGLDQADRLGQLQANAQKKTGFDEFASVAGGIGSLFGGAGTLIGGGIGLANKLSKPKKTAGVEF